MAPENPATGLLFDVRCGGDKLSPPEFRQRATVAMANNLNEVPEAEHRRSCRAGVAVVAIFILAGCAALAVDLPIARFLRGGGCPDDVKRLCDLTEVFGHGSGIGLLALAIFVLDPPRRRMLGCVVCASLGSGLAANGMKMLVARARPNYFDLQGSLSDTFVAWLPWLKAGSEGQSFPSGHAATAVGLAVVLAWLYPRGAKLFAIFAAMAAIDRLLKGHHFLSDVLWGGAIGYAIGNASVACARAIGLSPHTHLENDPRPALGLVSHDVAEPGSWTKTRRAA